MPARRRAIRKLVTCATQEGANITREYALNVIAEDIDVIVQLQVESVQQPTGRGGNAAG